MRFSSKRTLLAGVFLMCIALLAADVDAQTVVRRARLGNNTEDITFVNTGPLAKHIVIVDGVEVWAFPAQGKGRAKPRMLFDLSGMDMNWEPRGITWFASSQLFALNDKTDLVMVDHRGRVVERTPFVFPAGYEPEHLEGLAYLPHDSSFYPDHLMLVAMGGDPYTRLEIIRRDGVVVHEIIVDDELQWTYLGAIGFVAPDRILVSDYEWFYYLNFAGEITEGPFHILEGQSFEGVVQLANGMIAAAGYWDGTLFMLDEYLNHMPEKDRDYKIGFDLVRRPAYVAWNPINDQFLAINWIDRDVIAISPALDLVEVVANPPDDGYLVPRSVTVLPDEELMAFAHRNYGIHAILFYDQNGSFQEELDLSWLGMPILIEYMANTDEFLVRLADPGFESRLVVLGRDGSYHGEIDFAPAGIENIFEIVFFDPGHPSGGRLMIRDGTRVHITDLDGYWLDDFDLRTDLGVFRASLTAITTGPEAGAFAAMWMDNSELVVFTLP